MKQQVDWKRVGIFLAVAYGWAYAASVVIYQFGGLANATPWLGGAFNSYIVLTALFYMPAPALAHVVTRWVTREGWQDVYLRPKLAQGWRFWLLAWLGTAVLGLIGAVLFYALYPAYFDPSMSQIEQTLAELTAQTGEAIPFGVGTLALIQGIAALTVGIIINAPFMLGEEFGWRAYLQQKLMPLGPRVAMPLMGVVWGLWHAPLIAMGHNYGVGYPGAPWAGIAMMCLMTFGIGTVFGWLVLRGGSVWPAVIGHAVVNGFSGIVVFVLQGQPSPLIGPAVSGAIGSLGFVIAAVILLSQPRWWDVPVADTAEPLSAPDAELALQK